MILRPLLAVLTSAALAALGAADYAVVPAPQGDDSGSGKPEKPWATLRHALGRAGSGDTVYLLRGAVYRETPGMSFVNGVTVRGSGPADLPPPMITTSLAVPALTPWSKNPKVLTAKVEKRVLDCAVDGRFIVLARYPNTGFLRTKAGTNGGQIVDPDRAKAPGAAAGRWNGAQVRWRRWSWWWETRQITEDDGAGRLALGPDNRWKDDLNGIGSAWWVDNCLAELDAPGEWHWEAGTLYVYPPAGADPAKPLVEVVVEGGGFTCSGATLDGIGFSRVVGTALGIGGRSTITNCLFTNLADDAISGAWNAGGTQISGCTFRDVRNVGINWIENKDVATTTVFERNTFERIGMEFGYGGSGPWHAAGVIINAGKGITMRLNRLIDIGYAGVILGSEGNIVDRNVFVRCMGSLNDGSAVYTNCHRSTVRENIILDTIGNLQTSHPWYPLGHGIWPEFLSDFRESVFIGNTVFGSNGHGIWMPNNFKNEVKENVLVGNRAAGLQLDGEAGKGPQGHVMSGNVLVGMSPSRRLVIPGENIPGNWNSTEAPCGLDFKPGVDFGAMTGTTFVLSPGVPVAKSDGRTFDDAAAVRAAAPWTDPSPRIVRASALLLINDTEQPHDFTAPAGTWADVAGKPVGKVVTVAPFRSAVLARASDAAGLPPYVLASGIDYRAPPGNAALTAKAVGKTKAAPKAAVPATSAGTASVGTASVGTASVGTASAKPDPAAWERWVALLRERTAAVASGPKPPQFISSLMKAKVTVLAVDGDQATLKISGGGEMTANLFGRIVASDAAQLARALVRGDETVDHAMAAFFARCALDQGAYQEHLARAGAFVGEVEGAFVK